MKVTPSSNTELNADKKVDKQVQGKEFNSSAIEGQPANAGSEKSDFAGVLDKVTRSHQESSSRPTERGSGGRADKRDPRSEDKDKAESQVFVATSERPLAPEPAAITTDNLDAHAILHSADLERIVTACQVQLGANGQQEVTLILSRSMLEGLQVKVTTDGAGRVSANFLAANEGINSLLNTRSAELAEMLRARGIDLAGFKSSVATSANDRNESQREQQPAPRVTERAKSVAALSASEPATPTTEGPASGATYRA